MIPVLVEWEAATVRQLRCVDSIFFACVYLVACRHDSHGLGLAPVEVDASLQTFACIRLRSPLALFLAFHPQSDTSEIHTTQGLCASSFTNQHGGPLSPKQSLKDALALREQPPEDPAEPVGSDEESGKAGQKNLRTL